MLSPERLPTSDMVREGLREAREIAFSPFCPGVGWVVLPHCLSLRLRLSLCLYLCWEGADRMQQALAWRRQRPLIRRYS